MLNLQFNPEAIRLECEQIQSFLEITMSEDGNEAQARGNELAVYIARTGKMLADAKAHLNRKKQSDVMKMLEDVAKKTPFATAKTVNALVDSICAEEQHLVDWCERLNRTATHQLSWCVTVVSKFKEELKASGWGQNVRNR